MIYIGRIDPVLYSPLRAGDVTSKTLGGGQANVSPVIDVPETIIAFLLTPDKQYSCHKAPIVGAERGISLYQEERVAS